MMFNTNLLKQHKECSGFGSWSYLYGLQGLFSAVKISV